LFATDLSGRGSSFLPCFPPGPTFLGRQVFVDDQDRLFFPRQDRSLPPGVIVKKVSSPLGGVPRGVDPFRFAPSFLLGTFSDGPLVIDIIDIDACFFSSFRVVPPFPPPVSSLPLSSSARLTSSSSGTSPLPEATVFLREALLPYPDFPLLLSEWARSFFPISTSNLSLFLCDGTMPLSPFFLFFSRLFCLGLG